MKTPIKLDLSRVEELPKVDDVRIPAEDRKKMRDHFVVSAAALKEVGISNEDLEKLMDAKVLRPHWFLTCGDYNL